ncbi:MAG: MAPEG family protein [Actinomycetota bacterium]|nr:MAPEG family protein [Actinomycetota bacterium]
MTTSLATAVVSTAVLAAMIFVLGANVSRMRAVTAKEGGSQMPVDPASPLLLAIRAHGNAIEYVPTLLVLILLVGLRSPAWVAVPLIVGATLGRLLHAYGMLTAHSLAERSRWREAGAGGTYLFGIALAVAVAASLV